MIEMATILNDLRLWGARFSQQARMKRLSSMGFSGLTPNFDQSRRVLIVGAGPSATQKAVTSVRGEFDAVVTLNSAWRHAPDADVISYEFAFRNPEIFAQQKRELLNLPMERVLLKPYALFMMPRSELRWIIERVGQRGSSAQPHFVPHHNVSDLTLLTKPGALSPKKRLPVQWKGSLTMWLDLCWLQKVEIIGLIGTDLGEPGVDGRFVAHGTNVTGRGSATIIEMLGHLRRQGYLDGLSFRHFHSNTQLREVLHG
ncbi:hypothetical protein [Tropicimonas aquimaris]|uniref:Uncharacterized protein n=1 Tax=Tropicimonas aquimaris TaxID=914152 RepID=A0ABW3IZ37_9RHOB